MIFSSRMLFLCGFAILLPLAAQYDRAARRGTAGAASELSAIAREIRVTRKVREQLEDQARLLEYAVKHEQLNPMEMRRIQSILARIGKMLERAEKNGKMSASEAQALQKELSRAYRTLWFLRRNKTEKGQKIIFLNRQLVLREPYRKKFESGVLNQKEMREILHTYYSACRLREQLRTDHLKPVQRARLEKECFELLSEYFTLAAPENSDPATQKKK